MRYAFAKTILTQAQKNKNIMLLTADLGYSVFEKFRDTLPNQFINVGVAEQNMVSIATGLALTGKIVFAYSIATFATMRAYEAIRNDIATHNASVVIVGGGAGLSYGTAGISHHAIEDIAIMRVIPNMMVLCPSDPIEAEWATRLAIQLKKPLYLRLGKKGEPILYKKQPEMKLGKGNILQKGKDLLLVATGNMVSNTLEAAKLLKKSNINATVISMHSIKPFDTNLIKKLSKIYPLIVTVEEHFIIGGLGSIVAEIIAEAKHTSILYRIGIPDRFMFEIGSQSYLRYKAHLRAEDIAKRIIKKYKTLLP